jgi:hypothetical protein
MESVELVTSDDLAHARWSHRVVDGTARADVGLRDGRVLRSDEVCGTLNRLFFPPSGDLLLIQPGDRSYVAAERMAIFMAWLAALGGPLLNPPSPQCLCGRARTLTEWLWLAGKAGLAAARTRVSSDDAPSQPSLYARIPDPPPTLATVLVVGDRVVGPPLPPAVAEGCRRFAVLAHAPLLGLELTPDGELAGVSAIPELQSGGDELLDALAGALGAHA